MYKFYSGNFATDSYIYFMEYDQNRSAEINRRNKRLIEEIIHWADTEYKNLFDSLPLILDDRHKVWGYVFTFITMDAGKPIGAFGFYKNHPLPENVEDFFKEVYRQYFPGDWGLPVIRK